MDFINLNNISFSYNSSEKELLKNFTAQIPAGWTGIAGRNGCGKTTLLRLIKGDLEPLKGSISHPGQVYYIDQRTDLVPENFRDFLYSAEKNAGKIISLLNIDYDWPDRWSTLSHGERKRAQAGTALFLNPPVLLVDEPFNHLDSYSSHLIYQALKHYVGIGVIVSHNRDILDLLCERCIFMDPPDTFIRSGTYSDGKKAVQEEVKALEKMKSEQKRRVKKLRRSLGSKRREAGRSDKRASKGRIGNKDHDGKAKIDLARLSGKDGKPGREVKVLESRLTREMDKLGGIRIKKEYRTGIDLITEKSKRKNLIHYKKEKVSISDELMLHLPELFVGNDDRIGISGVNGSGKSTFMEKLVKLSDKKRTFHLPQEVDERESVRILERVKKLSHDVKGDLFSIVRRLDSDPKRVLESETPSPGEIRKILIAEGILGNPELLLLDEPTNHLDIVSIECLESALCEYNGAVVVISHDERFLNNICKRRWKFKRDENGFSLEENL